MRHVAVFGDYFEAVYCFCVADYVGEVGGAVFFDPGGGGVSWGFEDGGEGGVEGTMGGRMSRRWGWA